MAQVMTISGDVFVAGTVTPTGLTLPASSVTDSAVVAAAKIQATKLQHQYQKQFAQESATNAAVEGRVVHVVRGATATIADFRAGNIVAGTGTATTTIGLYKNGTLALSASVILDSTTTAYTVQVLGTLATTTAVAGDVLEIKVTAVNAGTGALAKGVWGEVTLREDAQ